MRTASCTNAGAWSPTANIGGTPRCRRRGAEPTPGEPIWHLCSHCSPPNSRRRCGRRCQAPAENGAGSRSLRASATKPFGAPPASTPSRRRPPLEAREDRHFGRRTVLTRASRRLGRSCCDGCHDRGSRMASTCATSRHRSPHESRRASLPAPAVSRERSASAQTHRSRSAVPVIVHGILLVLAGLVILVGGIVILDVRVVLFGLVSLLVGSFGIWHFVKWPHGQSSWWKR